MNQKVLITGSDGFIGSHLTEHLTKEGFQVRAFVMYNSFNSWGWLDQIDKSVSADIEVISGDIRDPNSVRNAVKGCDAVLHLAALIAIPFSYQSPDSYVDTNIKGTLNILQAVREFGTAQLLHTSTSEVYGTAMYVPIDEDHPLQSQSPYAATKVAADQLVLSYHRSFGVPATIIRPFNTYGPRQSARAVIPSIITQIASGTRRLRLGAISPTRDFNFVQDTVRGFSKGLRSSGIDGEVINIGSNFEVSIEATARLIASIMDVPIELDLDENRLRPEKSEVNRLWADNSKAQKLLGWTPEYGGLDGLRRGLSETIRWFSIPQNLLSYKANVYNI